MPIGLEVKRFQRARVNWLVAVAFVFFCLEVVYLVKHLENTDASSGVIVVERRALTDDDYLETTSNGLTLRVTPKRLEGAEDWIIVNVSGVRNPQMNDVLAIYAPGSETHIMEEDLPYKFVDGIMMGDNYLSSGEGSFRFYLVHPHTDYRVVFYQNATKSESTRPSTDGGLRANRIKMMSAPFSFVNPHLPTQGHLSVTDIDGEMHVMWVTSKSVEAQYIVVEDAEGFRIRLEATYSRYSHKDMCGWPANSKGWKDPGKLWSVTCRNLVPGSTYYYQFGAPTSGYSPKSSFVAPGKRSFMLKFMAAADLGKSTLDGSRWHWPHQNEASSTIDKMNEMIDSSEMLLVVGDISYAAGASIQWDHFMQQLNKISMKIPVMTVVGNHEVDWPGTDSISADHSGGECGVPTQMRFKMPQTGGKWWYSFDMESVHFLVFSTEHNFTTHSEQHKWILNDLQKVDRKRTPWIVMAGHRPMYHDEWADNVKADLVQYLEPAMYKYKVDVALWGHVHNYYRSCPMYQGRCDPNGIVHLLIGNGGYTNQGKTLQKAPWMLFQDNGYGFIHATATDRVLTVTYMSNDFGQMDKLILKRRRNL